MTTIVLGKRIRVAGIETSVSSPPRGTELGCRYTAKFMEGLDINSANLLNIVSEVCKSWHESLCGLFPGYNDTRAATTDRYGLEGLEQATADSRIAWNIASHTSGMLQYHAWFVAYINTSEAIRRAEAKQDFFSSYEIYEDLLTGDWDEDVVIAYLGETDKGMRHVLLGCMTDCGIQLTHGLQQCLLLLLIDDEPRVRNCACLALLAGGEDAESLLRQTVADMGLKEVAEFLECAASF